MINITIKQAEQRLKSREYLKKVNVAETEMNRILEESNWKDSLSSYLEMGNYSAHALLNALKNTMNVIEDEPSSGWLSFIYEKTRARMYPENFDAELKGRQGFALSFFMENYRIVIGYEKELEGFIPTNNLELLNGEEINGCGIEAEYKRFKKYWEDEYLFEFMRIGREITPFNTVGHIGGVHFVATFIGRQLMKTKLPIDIALVSASAAAHDLGKYGCKPEEEARTPYLHYYYSENLLNRINVPFIGHIASNHSTWDLELENLSVESLILIYADFRVKSTRENGVEKIRFYTLAEAFDVILSKLDNVDEKKKNRYRKVYAKLVDFENFIKCLGVETDINSKPERLAGEIEHDIALLSCDEVVENIKYLAIEHNIRIMNVFNNENDFASLIEAARTEGMWTNQRTYINVLSEYYNYMTKQEKLMTLSFLYDLLSDKEGDIRRQAARLMGAILSTYDEVYRKELPKDVILDTTKEGANLWGDYLSKILNPGQEKTNQHKMWIGYSLRAVLTGIIETANDETCRLYLDTYFGLFEQGNYEDDDAFILLDSVLVILADKFEKRHIINVIDFAKSISERNARGLKLEALRVAEHLTNPDFVHKLNCKLESKELAGIEVIIENANEIINSVAETSLVNRLLTNLNCQNKSLSISEFDDEEISELYRENLKTGTEWTKKLINMDFLFDYVAGSEDDGKMFRFAAHLANLIKVSDRINVRYHAGAMLLEVAELLPTGQINELVLEMTKVLETGDYQFSKYIPEYLGRMALLLNPIELDDFIETLNELIDNRNDKIAAVALDTVGELIKNCNIHDERTTRLLGMLLKGYANYHDTISQEAIWVIGQKILDSDMSLESKFECFRIIYKKLLALTESSSSMDMNFFTNAAALNCIYRFISDYNFKYGKMDLPEIKKVAFFPGTFDPFSLSHKGIVQSIRKKGFEVYLAIDEFSWSKMTQPKMIRRKIISMSVADQPDVYLFPDNIPINIANPDDLAKLRSIFSGRDVFMVAGSDVIIGASAYKAEPCDNSIHTLNHLIFKRRTFENTESSREALANAKSLITGSIEELNLPVYMEDISSTIIRDNIDKMRDISSLIDPIVQNYVFDKSLYLRENQYKTQIERRDISFEILNSDMTERTLEEEWFQGCYEDVEENVKAYVHTNDVSIATLRNKGELIGVALLSRIEASDLINEFMNLEISSYLRERNPGKILVIRGIMVSPREPFDETMQILLSEVLASAVTDNFTYALYHPFMGFVRNRTRSIVERQGFVEIAINGKLQNIYEVNMSEVVVLIENMNTVLKAPFNNNKKVLNVLKQSHKNLHTSLTKLSPGNLVLSINADVMNERLIKMITGLNDVPDYTLPERKLGANMCVPFGKILNRSVIPNTVTKAMHTEKTYASDMKSFTIDEYPNYSSIDDQVKTIKSFNRPVILVDDLIHRGFRLQALDPIFKANNLNVKKIVTGVLSGRGKDLMVMQGRHVECAYFIPNMKSWFAESSLYPFIGGDRIESGRDMELNMIPSVNLILPFASPTSPDDVSKRGFYEFSMVCLQNAYEIFKTLEEEHQHIFERQLTIRRLSVAVNRPRIPEDLSGSLQNADKATSEQIKEYIERLSRLKDIFEKL